ncbi:exostosin family-domain-containing protein [Dunaliella salina]|uniref:Exostosin family-domain-containing protein n=1 Tax=Dunaliella salina TaxID=3046 RepID=A0ABQ7G6W0_DUNSA|nr:exostosin family-domain-containing protein [Dunaliella salina]|eukprot:KAF5830347.1 exostosin family-domain-containing protein [Dunaliella salina]
MKATNACFVMPLELSRNCPLQALDIPARGLQQQVSKLAKWAHVQIDCANPALQKTGEHARLHATRKNGCYIIVLVLSLLSSSICKPIGVHVYDAADYPILQDLQKCGRHWRGSQWGTEHAVHDWFRTQFHVSPMEADFFYVPIYFKCASSTRGRAYVAEKTTKLLEQLKYYQVSGGEDHIFLFASGDGPTRFPGWSRYIPNAIFIMTEGHYNDGLEKRLQAPYHNPFKDLLIPGYTGSARRIFNFIAADMPILSRRYLATYIGNDQGRITRLKVRNLSRLHPDLIFAPTSIHDPEYTQTLGNSKFCLVPRGLSSWSLRLYESFLAGCIPVVLNDYLRFPFTSFISYNTISIKWPENVINEELLKYLQAVDSNSLTSAHDEVRSVKCFFSFHPIHHFGNCTALTAMSTELLRKFKRFKSSPVTFWTLQGGIMDAQLNGFESWHPPFQVLDVFDGKAKEHYGNQS